DGTKQRRESGRCATRCRPCRSQHDEALRPPWLQSRKIGGVLRHVLTPITTVDPRNMPTWLPWRTRWSVTAPISSCIIKALMIHEMGQEIGDEGAISLSKSAEL